MQNIPSFGRRVLLRFRCSEVNVKIETQKKTVHFILYGFGLRLYECPPNSALYPYIFLLLTIFVPCRRQANSLMFVRFFFLFFHFRTKYLVAAIAILQIQTTRQSFLSSLPSERLCHSNENCTLSSHLGSANDQN